MIPIVSDIGILEIDPRQRSSDRLPCPRVSECMATTGRAIIDFNKSFIELEKILPGTIVPSLKEATLYSKARNLLFLNAVDLRILNQHNVTVGWC